MGEGVVGSRKEIRMWAIVYLFILYSHNPTGPLPNAGCTAPRALYLILTFAGPGRRGRRMA